MNFWYGTPAKINITVFLVLTNDIYIFCTWVWERQMHSGGQTGGGNMLKAATCNKKSAADERHTKPLTIWK